MFCGGVCRAKCFTMNKDALSKLENGSWLFAVSGLEDDCIVITKYKLKLAFPAALATLALMLSEPLPTRRSARWWRAHLGTVLDFSLSSPERGAGRGEEAQLFGRDGALRRPLSGASPSSAGQLPSVAGRKNKRWLKIPSLQPSPFRRRESSPKNSRLEPPESRENIQHRTSNGLRLGHLLAAGCSMLVVPGVHGTGEQEPCPDATGSPSCRPDSPPNLISGHLWSSLVISGHLPGRPSRHAGWDSEGAAKRTRWRRCPFPLAGVRPAHAGKLATICAKQASDRLCQRF